MNNGRWTIDNGKKDNSRFIVHRLLSIVHSFLVFGQKAGQMQHLFSGKVSAKKTANVEEAAWFAKEQNVGPARYVIFRFILEHRFGDIGIMNGEVPSEPTASILRIQGDQLGSFGRTNQFFGLFGNSQTAEDMPGFWVGHFSFKGG